MNEPLWFEKPMVILEPDHLKNFVWLSDMTYNERQNATVRFALYLTIIGYVITRKPAFIYLFIAVLAFLYYFHQNQPARLAAILGDDSVKPADGFSSLPEQIGGAGPLDPTESLDPDPIGFSDPVESNDPAEGRPFPQTPCESMAQWDAIYGPGSPFDGYSNKNTDRSVVIDPATNQICKVSTQNNPFGNALPGDSAVKRDNPMCDPSTQKETIESNFNQNLFSDINDVWQRNNSQRQFIVENSTTIPNDRESFMKWSWGTNFVCKEDGDACFKQGY